jgi:hypothetical protein
MALDPVESEWLDPAIRWVDPVVVLGKEEVAEMVGGGERKTI